MATVTMATVTMTTATMATLLLPRLPVLNLQFWAQIRHQTQLAVSKPKKQGRETGEQERDGENLKNKS